jgi:hypothetical protein
MLQRMKKLAAVAAVVLAGFGGAQTASAGVAPMTFGLDSLLEGGSNANGVTIGDKHYSNFNFSSSGQSSLAAGDVDVQFEVNGNTHVMKFLLDMGVANGRLDAVIGYDLNVIDPARSILNVGLKMAGGPATGPGGGPVLLGETSGFAVASVAERIWTLDGSDLAVGGGDDEGEGLISVFNDGPGGLGDSLESNLAVNGTRGLRFEKDILVSAFGMNGGARITMVENSVTQNGTAIPLPAAFWAAMPILGSVMASKKFRRPANRN